MIKSVVFDWGGVLIEEPSSAIFHYCAKVLQIAPHDLIQTYQKFAEQFQKGLIEESSLWDHICTDLNLTHPTDRSLWETAFRHSYKEKKDTFQIAAALKRQGYRIGFLSNTEHPAMRFFQKQHYRIFDVTVFSCAEGTRKPEKRIYRLLLQRLHLPPEDVLFIDDNRSFIQGAQAVKINTILYENDLQLRQALEPFL
jgi:putative hydrolase of the HAD superfamily